LLVCVESVDEPINVSLGEHRSFVRYEKAITQKQKCPLDTIHCDRDRNVVVELAMIASPDLDHIVVNFEGVAGFERAAGVKIVGCHGCSPVKYYSVSISPIKIMLHKTKVKS
jgi:hypothetical protein